MSAQMEIIVHIGRPKTGSTTIQSFLDLNKEALVDQGIHYAAELSNTPSQKEFAIAACDFGDMKVPAGSVRTMAKITGRESLRKYAAAFEEKFAAARAKLGKDDTLVISCEQISVWFQKVEKIKKVDAYFKQFADKVRYVIYLRRQEDVIPSSYSQRIKVGQTISFQEHIDGLIKKLDYNKMVSNWAEAVGKDNILPALLEPDYLLNGDLVDDLCQLLKIDRSGLQTPPRANEALSVDATTVLRILNEIEPFATPEGDYNPRRNGVLTKLMEMSIGGDRQGLTRDQYEALRNAMDPHNEQLRVAFFPEREVLFPRRPDQKLVEPQEETNTDAIELALRLNYGAEPKPTT